jgi:hypothetical protein
MLEVSNAVHWDSNAPTFKSEPLIFIITEVGSKTWTLAELHGRFGGVFVSREAAIKYIKFEFRDRQPRCEIVEATVRSIENRSLDNETRSQPAAVRVVY